MNRFRRFLREDAAGVLFVSLFLGAIMFVFVKAITTNKNKETYCAEYETRAVYVYSTGKYEFASICIDEIVFIDRTGE